jgi:flavin-dependent dehydrogenase
VLAERAARAGAELRDGLAVRSLIVEPDGIKVVAQGIKTGSEFVAKTKYVIGADGANGVTVKATNLRRKRTIALAMEIEHPHTWGKGHPDLRSEVAHLEFGAVKRGYAWIFPKADHLNIGAGLFQCDQQDARDDRTLRAKLQQTIFQYVEAMGLQIDRDQVQFHAHPLPTWSGKERLHEGRILLAGDAAGLINPLFGDGILHAVKSGAIAAQCLAEEEAEEYTNRIHAEFAANFDAALNLSRVFYQWTGVCYKYGVKSEKATRMATQLLYGELLFTDIAGRAMRKLKRSVGANFFPAFNS